jgi:Fe-S-cluster-containing dehydrogenase component
MFPARVRAEDWSDKQEVTDRLTPYNWLTIQHASVTYREKTYELHIPRRCMHCDNPLCANLCPWGAAYKENSGTVRIDDDICLGGAKCRQVCPWDIPQRQTGVGLYLDLLPRFAGNGVMYKCDRCHDSVKQGALPACVEACPLGVQEYGPRDAIISKARKLAQATDGYLYGLDEAGGTSTIYVSPVPFDLLNTSLTRSAGHPDFPPVQPVLQPQKHLAGALMVAPLAGMAAGALKILGTLRKDRDSGHAPAAAHNKEQDHE